MDAFDDLLAPSRRELEDNPFADPFATRSGSPDPWATPFAHTQPANDYGLSTPTLESYSPTTEASGRTTADSDTPTSSDPLESPIHAVGGDNHQRRKSSSPGFRESVEPAPEPEETSTLPAEPLRPLVLPAGEENYTTSTPSSPTSSQERYGKQPPGGASHVFSPSPSTSKSPIEFISPLEQQSTIASIAGLSLGGASLGGWQSERSAWDIQAEDDSDDDKPISQTVKLHDHGDHKIVRRMLAWFWSFTLIYFADAPG
jgi:sorting nexin-1/2